MILKKVFKVNDLFQTYSLFTYRAKGTTMKNDTLVTTVVAKVVTMAQVCRALFVCPFLARRILNPIHNGRVFIFFFAHSAKVKPFYPVSVESFSHGYWRLFWCSQSQHWMTKLKLFKSIFSCCVICKKNSLFSAFCANCSVGQRNSTLVSPKNMLFVLCELFSKLFSSSGANIFSYGANFVFEERVLQCLSKFGRFSLVIHHSKEILI